MLGKVNHGTPLRLLLWVVLLALLVGLFAILSSPGAISGVRCQRDPGREFGCTFDHR